MKSEIDIIIETVKFYNSSNTAQTITGACTYMNEDGDMCAVGRCLSDEGMQVFKEFEARHAQQDTSISGFVNKHGWDKFENALKEEYRGHDTLFWERLQHLHDSKSSWTEDGITEYGLNRIDSMFGHNAYTEVKEALAQ